MVPRASRARTHTHTRPCHLTESTVHEMYVSLSSLYSRVFGRVSRCVVRRRGSPQARSREVGLEVNRGTRRSGPPAGLFCDSGPVSVCVLLVCCEPVPRFRISLSPLVLVSAPRPRAPRGGASWVGAGGAAGMRMAAGRAEDFYTDTLNTRDRRRVRSAPGLNWVGIQAARAYSSCPCLGPTVYDRQHLKNRAAAAASKSPMALRGCAVPQRSRSEPG